MGDFPLIDIPKLGGGMVIALVAMVHVVLAHFAVGTGILLHGLESADKDASNAGIQRAIKLLSLSVVYISFITGAITGVGIWFCISLFSADATQHLIQKFVWLWAVEWTFFVVEIVVGYLYYYRRKVLDWHDRRRLALLYALASWGSLLVITGILSYMLTSKEGSALAAWFNASVLPSVLLRTISSVAITCLVLALLVTIRPLFPYDRKGKEKRAVFKVLYRYLRWFFLLLPVAIWYRLTLPGTSASFAEGSSIPISMFLAGTAFFSGVVTLVALFAYRKERILQTEAAVLLLVMGVVATFTAEFVREGIRKPYIIYPILYSNNIWANDVEEWQHQADTKGSVLAVTVLYPGTPQEKQAGYWQIPREDSAMQDLSELERGEYIYRSQCMICHTRYGFNALSHLVRAWDDEDYADGVLENLHIAKPFMPPFVGTHDDRLALIRYLQTLDEEAGGSP